MNVSDLVRERATAAPDNPAILFRGRPMSYGDLDDRVDLTAASLAGLGVGPGDRVALLAGNVPEFVYGLYGTLRAGAVACPLNVMLTPEELGYILADCAAKVVVTELGTLSGVLSIRDRLADLETVIVIGGPPAPRGTVSLEEALAGEGEPPDVHTEASDLAVIAYTAGTTAAPKGAMLTHGNLLSNLDQLAVVSAIAPTEDDVVLLALPIFHIYGLNAILGLAVKSGAATSLMERFDPIDSLELIGRDGVTILAGAPPMFSAWLAAAGESGAEPFEGVRLAVSGASALPPGVFEAFRDRFGVTIWEGYGLTEAGPVVASNAVGPQAKPGSIGLPLPGVEVRLVDEDGDDVEDGDPGELYVRGPNVFKGYWDKPEATAEVFADDWLKTGDVAYQDEDGYLFLVDRKKDLVIVSGFNVFPREVEDAIERHPDVEEAAVVGIPDEHSGEAVQAWIVPREGRTVTEDGILDFLQGSLARFKWPKDVQIVDELPHHLTGKVLRRVLRGEDILGQEGPAADDSRPDEEPAE